MAGWTSLLTSFAGINADIFFVASLAMIGAVALGLGGWFTYQTHFIHPQLSYVPVDEEWHQYLGQLTEQARIRAEAPVVDVNSGVNNPESQVDSANSIWVDISGAVTRPGVYAVDEGSRWQDVVLQAGGFSPDANQQFLHQELNLSLQVKDQAKLYIPLEGEQQLGASSGLVDVGHDSNSLKSGSNSDSNGDSIAATTALINVNQATQSQLETLPNIGPKRAQDIILNRPYSSNTDFLERSGLSTKLAQELMGEMILIE